MKRTISAMSGKGSVNHNRRIFTAENVDPTRTHLNVEYCYTPIEQAYDKLFGEALATYNAKQKRKDRCIENYYEKIRQAQKDAERGKSRDCRSERKAGDYHQGAGVSEIGYGQVAHC